MPLEKSVAKISTTRLHLGLGFSFGHFIHPSVALLGSLIKKFPFLISFFYHFSSNLQPSSINISYEFIKDLI
jgi:hypothetical protein